MTANRAAEFAEMFERQRGEAFACAWSILARRRHCVREDAHDVVAQAALLGWKFLADYRGDGSLEAWFFRIVRNCAYVRSHRLRLLQWIPEMDDKHPAMIETRTMETFLIADARRAEMQQAVLRLPRILRQAVEVYCAEGLSKHAEAGRRIGVSESAFKARFGRAIGMLRVQQGARRTYRRSGRWGETRGDHE